VVVEVVVVVETIRGESASSAAPLAHQARGASAAPAGPRALVGLERGGKVEAPVAVAAAVAASTGVVVSSAAEVAV